MAKREGAKASDRQLTAADSSENDLIMPQKQLQVNGYSLFIERYCRPRMRDVPKPLLFDGNECSTLWAQLSAEQKEWWKQEAKTYQKTEQFKQERATWQQNKRAQMDSDPSSTVKERKAKAAKAEKARPDEFYREPKRYYEDEVDKESLWAKRDHDRECMKNSLAFCAPPFKGTGNERRAWFAQCQVTVLTSRPYCENDCQEFLPCELSAITFSIQDGIIRSKTFIIEPNENDLLEALYDQAQINEMATGIAFDRTRCVVPRRHDFNNILKTLAGMIECSYNRKAYVLRSQWNPVIGALYYLSNGKNSQFADYAWEKHFRFIEDYYTAFVSTVTGDTIPMNEEQTELAEQRLAKRMPPNSYSSRACMCAFHYGILNSQPNQAQHCTLAEAHFILFNIFDSCKAFFPTVLYGENHYPSGIGVAGSQRSAVTGEQRPSRFACPDYDADYDEDDDETGKNDEPNNDDDDEEYDWNEGRMEQAMTAVPSHDSSAVHRPNNAFNRQEPMASSSYAFLKRDLATEIAERLCHNVSLLDRPLASDNMIDLNREPLVPDGFVSRPPGFNQASGSTTTATQNKRPLPPHLMPAKQPPPVRDVFSPITTDSRTNRLLEWQPMVPLSTSSTGGVDLLASLRPGAAQRSE